MKIVIKGAGDLASGIAVRLWRAGYPVVMTEIEVPTAVRRTVSFSRAVYEKEAEVEGITAVCIKKHEDILRVQKEGFLPLLVDEKAEFCQYFHPDVLVDAILAKRNTGTSLADASLVIGVGPGFTVGESCHAVVETKRGHNLGRLILEGSAEPNTGTPGSIGGYTTERIIRARSKGIFEPIAAIGDMAKEGQVVALAGGEPVYARIGGMIRGLLQPGVYVVDGMKCGDVDPRGEKSYCASVSDKARAIGGGVLEAVCAWEHRRLGVFQG